MSIYTLIDGTSTAGATRKRVPLALVRSALSSLRDENLYINRASSHREQF